MGNNRIEDKFSKERSIYRFVFREVYKKVKEYIDTQVNGLRSEFSTLIKNETSVAAEAIKADIKIPMDEINAFIVQKISENIVEDTTEESTEPASTIDISQIRDIVNSQLALAEEKIIQTGDTIIINETQQNIVEKIREVVHTNNIPVDYDAINRYLEERLSKYHAATQAHGTIRSIRFLSDVDLTGVPQDSFGNFKLGQTSTGGGIDWSYYATTWSTEPTFVESITGGDVYAYTLDGTTRYRFVPTTYDPTQDAFYSSFSSPTLSGLIVARG